MPSAYDGQNVPLVSPPATLTAGVDTALNFGVQVRGWTIENHSAAPINYALDVVATAGSYLLPAGMDASGSEIVTVLHILAPTALTVNGTTAGGIVVAGSI